MDAWGMACNTLSFNSFSKPFITEETSINTVTPRAIPKKPALEINDKNPVLLLLKYLTAMNKGKKFMKEKKC